MLYICIFSNKFDLIQTTRVSHGVIFFLLVGPFKQTRVGQGTASSILQIRGYCKLECLPASVTFKYMRKAETYP